MKPILHPATALGLANFAAHPAQAALVHGTEGIGLDTIGLYAAQQLTKDGGTITHIIPDSTTITIEQIRELYVTTRSKAASRRVIVIHEAGSMQAPAQNAFLKLLEEPTQQTYFVLLTHSLDALLPTIRSRVQQIELLPISDIAAQKLLTQHSIDAALGRQILFIAPGLPAEIVRLATDENYRNQQFALATIAKQLISSALFDRLALIQKLSSDRQQTLHALQLAARMLSFQLLRQPSREVAQQLDRLQIALAAIRQNGSLKAQLLRLLTA
ncbi:MAG TPA: hypothetical protein VH144_02055 [Candidatus Saccharimonadales bacterium]|jgi:DNA polymerase-3 subunit delta'|nr:hypothetical protein [Candidatus Saccharimonadales bacterium]